MYVSAITKFLLKAGLFELLKAIEISKYVIFFIFIYKKYMLFLSATCNKSIIKQKLYVKSICENLGYLG